MPRQTWLADELRKAGLRVVEVPGWLTRGSDSFAPVGVTWHATAGSRSSTAQAEVHVILTGSTSAPAPISQLMIYRDGTVYVCASGRCNHNKVGWDGPNKGLGNTQLVGIEMANDNKGEPWPAVQLDAARRATAAIMRRLGADPMKRLAAHYEHQHYATRPAGETSTKSDPYGVRMSNERPRVAEIMKGGAEMPFADEKIPVTKTTGAELYEPDKAEGTQVPAHVVLQLAAIHAGRANRKLDLVLARLAQLAGQDFTDEAAIAAAVIAALPSAQAIADAIPSGVAAEVVELLAARMAQ